MIYKYWLSRNLSNSRIHYLRNEKHHAEELWKMSEKELNVLPGLTDKDKQWLLFSRNVWDLSGEWFSLLEKGISFVSLEDKNYPEKLASVQDAPYGLYYTGSLPQESRMQIAVVGARGRSSYGSMIAKELGRILAKHEIEVISGLALGIDADAHLGCLEGGGRTFAVLGSGVDVIYPRQNDSLYRRILAEGGGILSEFPPGTQPLPRQFPSRNRIISGLSDKIVVVEAREKSGSLITADHAIEQGRDVYAVPGRITDELSMGCNRLIRQGAGTLISLEDFMEELDIETGMIATQLDFRKELMEKEEALVYSLLDFQPVSLSSLLTKTAINLPELLTIMESLCRKGFIREPFPNYYVKSL